MSDDPRRHPSDDDTSYDDALLDARVRRGVQAVTAPDGARTEEALDDVLSRSRSRTTASRAWVVAAAAVTVLVVVLAPLLLRDRVDDTGPAAPPAPGPTGTWVRDVDAPTDATWTGSWGMDLRDGGVLVLDAPAGARGVTDAMAYVVEGPQLRVDAFVNSVCDGLPPGSYVWSRTGDRLVLDAVGEQCAPRREVFEGAWTADP